MFPREAEGSVRCGSRRIVWRLCVLVTEKKVSVTVVAVSSSVVARTTTYNAVNEPSPR